ncbi:nicotinate-nucleotide adenylyltransferase [Geobacter sp. SVR]|uniref:nicotinate-nucleotide adenylyltransferase n=1 Tax=Geobacter sp. SVR TaxID=2495594 RepID=UPI00143EF775|nr:nicotinate-nucleotide adenylyltransferase [Geobacter sp. SVR]BCS56096.1 putative nicotinate-nucleotide adenylyltransferase [Geobacter sp. SVR]GCF84859.1 putative nicotinate-nucleotide adenylyltransferase [Geobacter sp. SVR]
MSSRIGLMGGTFNPVHLAHLRIAEEARDMCGLDRVIFIPAGDPPHKPLAGEVPFTQRCEMVRRAIAGNPAFELSEIEGQRAGKSYSIDTIAAFRLANPDDQLFFIIGSDSFLEIGLWHRFAEIFRSCSLIVVERPGCPVSDPSASLPAAIRAELSYSETARLLEHRSGTSVQFVTGCPLAISSSEIRRLAAAGRSITYLVPPQVGEYIKEQRIYQE